MSATNVNASISEIAPLGGANGSGIKQGFLASTAKAAQNDTITILNIKEVLYADLRDVTTGAAEAPTISGKVITLTGAATGNVYGTIVYK